MLKIIIVNQHPVLRAGLVSLLTDQYAKADLIAVAEIEEFQNQEFNFEPDLFLLDANGQISHPFLLIRELKLSYPSASIIVDLLTPTKLSLRYLKSGVKGILSGIQDLSEIIASIETVLSGRHYLSPPHQQEFLKHILQGPVQRIKRPILTQRQQQIANYLILDMKTSTIANRLGLKYSTISSVKANIFTKFGVDSVEKLKKAIG